LVLAEGRWSEPSGFPWALLPEWQAKMRQRADETRRDSEKTRGSQLSHALMLWRNLNMCQVHVIQ
jgi:hypothetical protein